MTNFTVKKVAVLGAGVMGAQIAAHCVNAKVPVVLFDLPAKEGPKNGIVLRAIENLKKLSPAPLGNKDDASLIEVANYEDNLDVLAGCDLIIEAIAERMDWKHDLYAKVAPHIAPKNECVGGLLRGVEPPQRRVTSGIVVGCDLELPLTHRETLPGQGDGIIREQLDALGASEAEPFEVSTGLDQRDIDGQRPRKQRLRRTIIRGLIARGLGIQPEL